MTDQKKERPTFLTVLCILTFVGAVLGIIGQLFTLAMAPMMRAATGIAEEGMEDAMDELAMQSPEMGGFMQKLMGQSMAAMAHLKELAIINIVGILIVLFGAIMMWKLKKTGYFLFVGGKAFILIASFIVLGAGGLAFGAIGFSLFVAVLFSVLYGLNLKHMK